MFMFFFVIHVYVLFLFPLIFSFISDIRIVPVNGPKPIRVGKFFYLIIFCLFIISLDQEMKLIIRKLPFSRFEFSKKLIGCNKYYMLWFRILGIKVSVN